MVGLNKEDISDYYYEEMFTSIHNYKCFNSCRYLLILILDI